MIHMKSSKLIILSAVLIAAIAVTGFAFYGFAQDQQQPQDQQMQQNQGMMGSCMNVDSSLSDQQKQDLQQKMSQCWQEMSAKQQQVDNAIGQGYDAWSNAVKQNFGDNAPILQKINQNNFSQYVQAHNLMNQAMQIYQDLGLSSKGK